MRNIRFERRLNVDVRQAAIVRVAGAVIALLVAGLLLALTGRTPFSLLTDAFDATMGDRRGIDQTLVIATPILMNALAVAIGMRMKLWNIGSEGQFFMGAWAATGVGIFFDGPAVLNVLFMALAGIAAGALWILVPALARAFWNVNEIITTLLLNFVALQIVNWFSFSIWRDKEQAVTQSTREIHTELGHIPGSATLHIGIIVPFVIAAILIVVFRYTRWGFEVDMIGGNPRAAEFAGIGVKRRIVVVMLISGGIAGLSGMLHLAGASGRLNGSISSNYGLSGFIVAALAGASIIGVIIGGLFIAAMFRSGIALQTQGLSQYIVNAIYGLVLLGVALGEVASRFRLVRPNRPPRDTAGSEIPVSPTSPAEPVGTTA